MNLSDNTVQKYSQVGSLVGVIENKQYLRKKRWNRRHGGYEGRMQFILRKGTLSILHLCSILYVSLFFLLFLWTSLKVDLPGLVPWLYHNLRDLDSA